MLNVHEQSMIFVGLPKLKRLFWLNIRPVWPITSIYWQYTDNIPIDWTRLQTRSNAIFDLTCYISIVLVYCQHILLYTSIYWQYTNNIPKEEVVYQWCISQSNCSILNCAAEAFEVLLKRGISPVVYLFWLCLPQTNRHRGAAVMGILAIIQPSPFWFRISKEAVGIFLVYHLWRIRITTTRHLFGQS